MTRPAPAPVAPPWERADALLAVDHDRILAYARERRAAGPRGAVVVDLDAGPGAPLGWLTYDPRELVRIGSHWNAALGVLLREPAGEPYQATVFLSGGRKVWSLFFSEEHEV